MDFQKTLFGFYKSVIKKFPVYFISIFFISVVSYVLDVAAFPYVNKWAFSVFEMAGNGQYDSAIRLIILIAIYFVTLFVFLMVKRYINGRMQPIISRYVNYRMYNRIYNNDTEFFINRPAGQIANKVGQVQNNFYSLTIDFWISIIATVIGFGLILGPLFGMNIWLAAFVIFCSAVRSLWQLWRQKPINKISKKLVDVSSNISGIRTDSLGNAIAVKLFANSDYENQYIYNKQETEVESKQKRSWLGIIQWSLSSFMFMFMQVGIIIICWILIGQGDMIISDAAFAFVGGRMLAGMFSQITDKIQDYSENLVTAKHAYDDIIQDMKIIDAPNARNLKITNAQIDFDNVSFNYGADDIIKSFNLNVGHNEKIGLVGLSGAGKTTLVNLMLRMYDVNSGVIKIDGSDIRDVRQVSLRRQIAFVPQESELFNRTLLENIKYARPSATRAMVIAATKRANIHDFINGLPDKYDTLVGNRGIKLSGGQRQRISIARAILKDAPILILDEATSALDSKNELLIQGALQKIMKGKTTIAIAHRLSTLRNMDRIIVIDRGHIVQSGTHAQLLRKKGIYKKLWDMQTGGFIS